MVYKVTADSFTKISERSGTIYNIAASYTVEMSSEKTFNSGILIRPNQLHTFSNTDIYLRCVEEGFTAEVHVVPFIVDGGGSTSTSVVVDGGNMNVATDAEVDAMIDEFLPTIKGGK